MRDKKIQLIIAVLVVGALIAGGAIFASSRKDEPIKNSNTNSQTNSESANMDSSMQSMADQLKGKTGDEYDKAFLNLMAEHHAAAIAMAKRVDTEAKHSEIQTVAGQIISAQEKEIAQMRSWASQWGYMFDEPNAAAAEAMAASLNGKTGDELDHQFIIDMIAHHMGAIEMANLSAQNAKHAEIKQLSEDIFMAQTLEIGNMQDWAKAWGYDIGSSGPSMQGHQM